MSMISLRFKWQYYILIIKCLITCLRYMYQHFLWPKLQPNVGPTEDKQVFLLTVKERFVVQGLEMPSELQLITVLLLWIQHDPCARFVYSAFFPLQSMLCTLYKLLLVYKIFMLTRVTTFMSTFSECRPHIKRKNYPFCFLIYSASL